MKNLIAAALAAVGASAFAQHPAHPKGTHAQAASKSVQKATVVVNGGFRPASITVKAGQPVQITFDTKHRTCATSVIFAGLKLSKTLTNGKKTVVTFTPKKSGTYGFACPMKMMTGKVVAK